MVRHVPLDGEGRQRIDKAHHLAAPHLATEFAFWLAGMDRLVSHVLPTRLLAMELPQYGMVPALLGYVFRMVKFA